jgi:hypothetical protein
MRDVASCFRDRLSGRDYFGFFLSALIHAGNNWFAGLDNFWFRQTDNRCRSLGVGTGGAARDV